MISICTRQIVLFEIPAMKALILFLDGVNIARSYLSHDNKDSITCHTEKNGRISRDPT